MPRADGDPFPPHVLREYAFLADGERGALVGPQGDICWLCVPHWDSDAVFAYSEQLSKQVVGYEPKQILLLHGNQLEADHIGELLDVFRKRGYRFITLEDALSDQAYSLPDTYVGEEGTGWLDHWAICESE